MGRSAVLVASVFLLLSGVALAYAEYLLPPYALNPYQAAGSTLFWGGALLLLFGLVLWDSLKLAWGYARSRAGAAIGGAYITVHLLLYGFILEGILVALYGIPPFVYSSAVYLSTDALYPPTLVNALVGLAVSPTFNFQFPPVFEISLSTFSIFIALAVDILILANLAKVKQIGGLGSLMVRSRAYMVMPVTGVILGASCCMSLPVLLSIVSPSLEAAGSVIWAFYFAYFVLPPLAIVLLKLNLDFASKVAVKASRT